MVRRYLKGIFVTTTTLIVQQSEKMILHQLILLQILTGASYSTVVSNKLA